jgi:catechol-2,3-dioxygenase
LQEIKKIEIKIKKLEKEEKNYEKLMGREVEEYKTHDVLINKKKEGGKGPSGVYLLSD